MRERQKQSQAIGGHNTDCSARTVSNRFRVTPRASNVPVRVVACLYGNSLSVKSPRQYPAPTDRPGGTPSTETARPSRSTRSPGRARSPTFPWPETHDYVSPPSPHLRDTNAFASLSIHPARLAHRDTNRFVSLTESRYLLVRDTEAFVSLPESTAPSPGIQKRLYPSPAAITSSGIQKHPLPSSTISCGQPPRRR